MKTLLAILFLPLCCSAQYYLPGTKLAIRTKIHSDSGTIKGFFVADTDSTLILSTTKRFSNSNTVTVPVNSIRKLYVNNRQEYTFPAVAGATILGFTLAAGLIQNNDYDNDGKTSFFELVFSAIEGTTSKNRRRRNTSLIVGGVGGLTAMVLCLIGDNRFSLSFPLGDRNKFYKQKRAKLRDHVY